MVDQRKLIRLGNSSFAIALPKAWVEKSGLKKGENVFIEENSGGELVILPQYQKVKNGHKKVIDIKNKPYKEIEREIIATYIQGNDILEIPVDSKAQKQEIKKIFDLLPSVEIMDYNNSKIIANDLIEVNGLSISNIMRRIDNITRSMFEDLTTFIEAEKISDKQIQEILETDQEVNKFYYLLWKIMLSGLDSPSVVNVLNTNYPNLVVNWWIGVSIERIADEVKRIARLLRKFKLDKKDKKFVSDANKFVFENYINALNSYYKQDKALALDVSKQRDKLKKDFSYKDNNINLDQIMDRYKIISSQIHDISKSVLYFIK